MSKWEAVAVRDVADVFDGPHATPAKTDDGPWYLSISSLSNGRFDFTHSAHLAESDLPRWTKRVAPRPGDTLFSYETRLGEAAFWEHDVTAALGRRMGLLRPKDGKVEPRYLAYAYLGPQFQEVIRQKTLHGATVNRIPVGDIPFWPIVLPPLEEQRAILGIVGSIDDLIANNRRRVDVLEEMARAIYREWFVKLRYPGRQDVPLVDSALGPIPEGWEVRSVSEVARVVRGRSYRSAELVEEGGLPFINLKCMARGGGFKRNGLKRYVGQYKQEQLVGAGDLVLAVTDLTQGREILARATLVPRLREGRGVISLDVIRLVPIDDPERLWIFASLAWSDFSGRLKEFANGSTVLHLSPRHVEDAPTLWAPDALRRKLAAVIEPCLAEIEELSEQADTLAALRDLLLPKLVTGEVDVSSLNLDALLEGQVA